MVGVGSKCVRTIGHYAAAYPVHHRPITLHPCRHAHLVHTHAPDLYVSSLMHAAEFGPSQATPSREFVLRMSAMEIYNEVWLVCVCACCLSPIEEVHPPLCWEGGRGCERGGQHDA